jgi:SAM-dependent methyltransferase
MSSPCLLCGSSQIIPYYSEPRREYFSCEVCALVFIAPSAFPTSIEEKARYDTHNNDPNNVGYRTFLSKLGSPMIKQLPPGSSGLDFGSGPGPTLSLLFEEEGFEMAIYDPFYAPDKTVLKNTYDFITLTEVIEHLHTPLQEIEGLLGLLKPGGRLGVMTTFMTTLDKFPNWYYKNDNTHVGFYSEATFRWLAEYLDVALEVVSKDVVILKPDLQPR